MAIQRMTPWTKIAAGAALALILGCQHSDQDDSDQLTQAQTDALLASLPAIEEQRDDRKGFVQRPDGPPAPIADGKHPTFPPQTDTPPSLEAEAPRVLRYAPQGEIDRAELISLSFSEPMVALDRHASEVTPPIRLSPKVVGSWRWVDTRTLIFDPKAGRLPMATDFEVRVDADMTSAAGVALETPHQWNFSTAALAVTQSAPEPSKPVSRRPVMTLVFNQSIDRADLLEHLRLTAGDHSFPLALASEVDIEQDLNGTRDFIDSLDTDYWVALVPEPPSNSVLPPDSELILTLPAGAPALEGYRTSTDEQSVQFRTVGPLRITDVECGYGNRCAPDREWRLTLSQRLFEHWSQEDVDISPELANSQFRRYGNHLVISGDAKSNTEYTVTLKAGTKDWFGQELESDISARVKVNEYSPSIKIPSWPNLVLAADQGHHFPIITRNVSQLTVAIRRVDPQQWQAFSSGIEQAHSRQETQTDTPLPGELVQELALTLDSKTDQYITTRVSLEKALNESGTGHAIVSVQAPELNLDPNRTFHERQLANQLKGTWVQITRLGVSQYQEPNQQLVWVTDLASGKPLKDVHVEHTNADAATGADGTATLPRDRERAGPWLLARTETDSAFISRPGFDRDYREYIDTHSRYPLLAFLDRGIYRPGETLHAKGVLRELTPSTAGDIHWPQGVTHVHWNVRDGQYNEIANGKEALSSTASFDFRVPIPKTASLGQGEVSFRLQMDDGQISSNRWPETFQIQEFRRPEYRVSTEFDSNIAINREPLSVDLQAVYYSGSPLPSAPLEWQIEWHAGHYSPPGWLEYRFGKTPDYHPYYYYHSTPEGEASLRATTDQSGQHSLRLIPNKQLKLENIAYPHKLIATAEVTDINRQRWSSQSEILLHPGNIYVGVKPASRFVSKGDSIEVELTTVDIDGNVSTGNTVEVTAEHLERNSEEWLVSDSQHCTFTSRDEPQHCVFDSDRIGQYRITAEVKDNQGRSSKTQLEVWVSGSGRAPTQWEETPQVRLTADKDIYRPGDTAQIQVDAPFRPAQALITLHRQGILEHRQVALDDGSHLLQLPITEAMIPGFSISVEAVGSIDDSARAVSPGQALGQLDIDISTDTRNLNVEIALDENRVQPGDTVRAHIQVSGYQNNPIDSGELTFYAVDESILDLTNHPLPDGDDAFYWYIDRFVDGHRLRDSLMLTPSDASEAMLEEVIVSGERAMAMGMAAHSPEDASPQSLRSNFDPLAVFKATLPLDHNGQRTIEFDLPDSLTRYRVMAFVHTERKFGSGQAELEVNLPLMVRPSAPRFLNLGDRAELPVVVQNTTDRPLSVDLALRASNLTLEDPTGRQVTVPANDRKEVRFKVQPQVAGTARLQVVAQAGEVRDATAIQLPVLTPATTEAFAQYGSLTSGVQAYPLQLPTDVYPDFGGLEISTSSTQLHSLSDAFRYLLQHPYGSSEQLASRLMSIVSLGPMAQWFSDEEIPTEAEMEERVTELLAQLQERQNRDGGWNFWRRGGTSQAYVSVHVTHALLRAREAGHSLPDDLLRPAIDYLAELERTLDEDWDGRQRQALLAYRLYVQQLAGTLEPTAATALFDRLELDDTSMETLGWLLAVTDAKHPEQQTMRSEILRRLNNNLRETAAGAQFIDDYPKGGHRVLHGSRRTDAVILDALLNIQPDHELIEKTARGLLNQRQQGRWGNTQENVFVLQALKAYIQTQESEQPDMVARAWLGSLFLGEQTFEGRSTEGQSLSVPMAELQQQTDPSPLTLQNQGQGRLYYRLGMRYAPEDLLLDPAAHGIRVEREYQALQDENDVQQTDDGRWQIRAGTAVRVKLAITLPARRHHLALTDYLPAGLEALNPELEGTANRTQSDRTSWPAHWYNHQQLRDERVEVFATQLEAGVYHFEYNALATTPGAFIAPPAKAEEQYQPETFGRSGTHQVEVVANH